MMCRPVGGVCLPIAMFFLPAWIFLLCRSFQPQGHRVFLIVVPLHPHSPQHHQPPSAQMMNDCTLWKGPSPINKLISPLSLLLQPVNNELWVSLLITIIVNVKRGPLASCPTPLLISFFYIKTLHAFVRTVGHSTTITPLPPPLKTQREAN